MSDPIRVPLDMACPCPGTPHTAEWVDLAPRLGIVGGAAASAAMRFAERTTSEVEAAVAASFLRHGIVDWSFTGEPEKDGRRSSLPITNANINAVLDWASAREVAERANDLYSEDLLRPLLAKYQASLSDGATEPPISAPTVSGRKRPKSSSSSSGGSTAGLRSVANP